MNKKRYLVKLSGEILKGKKDNGISWGAADKLAERIKLIIDANGSLIELGFVIGGGNIFRGASQSIKNYNRVIGDQIGMVSTIINSLTLKERLEAHGVKTVVQSAIKVEGVVNLFDREKIENNFKENGVVIFSGGLGIPYLSTDTTSALRALQIDADAVLKATKVDGIYDKDPVKFPDAKYYDKITYQEVIEKSLKIMDLSAMILLKENNMKLQVFNYFKENSLEDICAGKNIGTIVEK